MRLLRGLAAATGLSVAVKGFAAVGNQAVPGSGDVFQPAGACTGTYSAPTSPNPQALLRDGDHGATLGYTQLFYNDCYRTAKGGHSVAGSGHSCMSNGAYCVGGHVINSNNDESACQVINPGDTGCYDTNFINDANVVSKSYGNVWDGTVHYQGLTGTY